MKEEYLTVDIVTGATSNSELDVTSKEPEFWKNFAVEIYLDEYDREEIVNRTEIGSMNVSIFDIQGMIEYKLHPIPFLDELDNSGDLMYIIDPSSGGINHLINELLGKQHLFKLLCIDHLILGKAFRGKGYGLRAIDTVLKTLGDTTTCACMSTDALQFHPPYDKEMTEFTQDREVAYSKLKNTFAKIGFKPLSENTELIPEIEQLPGWECMIRATI